MIGAYQAKDPGSIKDFQIDWLGGGILRTGETVAASVWSLSPSGLVVVDSSFTASTSTVRVSGGEVGTVYRLTCRMTTSLGAVEEQSFTVRVEDL